MSGCCGQGPVIVSGAAAAPRLDVETQLMCDVLPDGTVAATVLVEPIYDTSSGVRVATRITDPATGDEYTPVGEIRVCAASPDCESPTTPVTSVGLCLADGTPIAVTITRDCTGATTAEGWLNLTTGAWSAGAVPAGTMACGDARTITVSGTFCDVDDAGEVVGLVLVEYTYDDTGAITAVRLVDAVTGGTYTPTGTVTVCPAGVEQPERDLVQLCDVAADGTVTPMIRDYARDENGAIVGHSDYALDGTAYTPEGTVGLCPPEPDREVVCYRSPTAFGPCTNVQITDLPQPRFTSASVVANPQNWPVSQTGLDSTFNGNVTGAGGPTAPEGVINCDGFQGDTGVVIDYLLAEPRDNVTAVRLWNSFGGNVTDNDGIGSATVTLYDGAGTVLFTGPLVACQYASSSQYATPCVTPVGNLDGVARMRLENLAKFPPAAGTVAPDIGWREIDLFSTYEATLTVDCGGVEVSALVEGEQPGLTYSEGQLTQVNGPHTLTFTAPGGATGRIITDNPAAFSTLDFSDGSVITVAGDGAVDFATEIISGAATKAGYVTWDPVTGEPIVRDANSGEVVADADVVPCTTGGSGECCDGSAEPCRDTSTVLVCDVPDDSSTAITPTIVDGTLADVGQTQFQPHPGPNAPLWSGGTFVYPAGAGPTQEHLGVVGQITADMAGCDGAAGTLTISVRVRNDGPDAGQAWDGALRLFRGTTGIATHNALEWAPVGWQGTLTVSAPVTAADIAAGDIRVALLLETYHLGAKSWTADQFTVSLELEGCEVTASTQFLRTLVTDCETGEAVSTTDTTLDGQPYTVTGTVGQCTPASTVDECRDCEQTVLCDVSEEEGTHSFLRSVCRDCTGAVINVLDTELDGTTPYGIVGTVGSCGPDDCLTTSVQTIRLCDLDPTVEADEEGRRCAVPFLRHLAYDCDGALLGFHDTGLDGTTPYTPVQVVDCQCETGEGLTSSIEVPWQTVSVAEDPAGLPQQDFIYTVSPENDPARIGTIHVHVSRPAGGACGAYDINNLVFSNTAAYTLTLDAVAQEMSYLRVDLLDFDTFEPVGISSGSTEPTRLGGTAGWNPAHTRIVPSENNGTGYMYWDNPPETIAWTVFNAGGGTSCGALSFQGMTVEPGGCCGGDEAGCNDCAPVNTGVRNITGTAPQDLAGEFPDLQSVSLTVLAGTVNATMTDGAGVPIPAGVTLTWSVATDADTALSSASFAGADAGAGYLLNWTRK
ncbi:hypothetical protein ACPCSG_26935 [Streptomyces cellulosae]